MASEVDEVVAGVSVHAAKTLRAHGGIVQQSGENAAKILAIGDAFQESLDRSNYYPTILAFVSSFVGQVDDFDSLHEGTPLSSGILASEDRDVLSHQAAIAVAVLEDHSAQVGAELRQSLSRTLGDVELRSLTSETCAIARKMSRVGPIGKDQCNLWFRLLGSLVYRRVENQGTRLAYTYAGARTKSTRGFCSRLLAGGPLSLGEIAALDNGQTPDALLNCGGYGCNHLWFGESQGNPL